MNARLRAHLALVCVVLAPILSASTCDDIDVSGRRVVVLAAGEGSAMGAWQQPYVGRLAIDFGLRNTGTASSTYALTAQIQTSGDPTDTACSAFARTDGRPLALVPPSPSDGDLPAEGGALTLIRELDTTWATVLPADGVGFAELRVVRAGSYALTFDADAAELRVITGERTDVVPDETTIGAMGCDNVGARYVVPLDEGTYRLRIAASAGSSLRLHVEEDCATRRTVPRTCPGAVSERATRTPSPTLAPGAFVSGRLHADALGIGDQAVVALGCESPADCAGELEIFFVVEQLECRNDNDCTNVETCSVDGYCLREAQQGCAAAPARGSHGLSAAFCLLWLWRSRWRGRVA